MLSNVDGHIKNDDLRSANRVYEQLNDLYLELPEGERSRFYPEIRNVYKKIGKLSSSKSVQRLNEMIGTIENLLSYGKTDDAKDVYKKAHRIYARLSEKEKTRVYRDIQYLFNKLS